MAENIMTWLIMVFMNVAFHGSQAPGTAQNPSTSSISTSTPVCATTPRPQQVITPSDKFYCRLRKLCSTVCRQMVFQVYLWGTNKDESVPLNQYLLQEKGWSQMNIDKRFSALELERFRVDPKGDTYDITLLYKIIPWACESIAPKGHEKWTKAGNTLEYYLTQIKNLRNFLMHESNTLFDNTVFVVKVDEVRDILTNMLEAAGRLYNIDEGTVQNIITEMNKNINDIRDKSLSPQDLLSYRTDSLFTDMVKFVKTNGKEELKTLYKKTRITYVSPATFLAGHNLDVEVEQVFTPLKLTDGSEGGREQELKYDDILECDSLRQQAGQMAEELILVEGIAGAGKTTITRHIVSQWCNEGIAIKRLHTYDQLILMECRNSIFSSLSELLDSLMPRTRENFQDNDLLSVFRQQKALIIVDGLDEMNESSRKLFKDILVLKKNTDIQIITFSRPGKVMDFYTMVESEGYVVTHIKVGNIPANKQEEFVKKYHKELKIQGQNGGDVSELIRYMRTTRDCLDTLWGLPLNLVMLTVMWAFDHTRVKEIHTSTELYLKTLMFSIEKLSQRLIDQLSCSIDELRRKIEIFLFTLSKVSIEGLRDDIIVLLSNDQVLKLQQVCSKYGLPHEEVFGAFLVRKNNWTSSCLTVSVSIPHKAFQDLLAGLFLFHKSKSFTEIDKEEEDLILPVSVSEETSKPRAAGSHKTKTSKQSSGWHLQSFINMFKKKAVVLSKFHGFLVDLYKGKQNAPQLFNFGDSITHLLSLLYMDGDISPDTAKEVVDLLMLSNYTGFHFWVNILRSVKYDDIIAKAMALDPRIKEYDYSIHDGEAYAAYILFTHVVPKKVTLAMYSDPFMEKGMDEMLPMLHKVECHLGILQINDNNVNFYLKWVTDNFLFDNVAMIEIDDGTKSEWNDLLLAMGQHQIKINKLSLPPSVGWSSSASLPENISVTMVQSLLTCQVKTYFGRASCLEAKGRIPIPSVQEVHLFVKAKEDIETIVNIKDLLPNLIFFHITFDKSISALDLKPLSKEVTTVFLPTLTEDSEIEWGADVAKALQRDSEWKYDTIRCRHNTFSAGQIHKFVELLSDAGVRVNDGPYPEGLDFRSVTRGRLSYQQRTDLKDFTNNRLGCNLILDDEGLMQPLIPFLQ